VTSAGRKLREANELSVVKLYGFSSEKKMASVLVRGKEGLRLYNKGAAEWVLRKCTSVIDESGQVRELRSGC
jgi:P-type Ca2+ transporter type 2C